MNPVDWLYTDLRLLPFPYPPTSLPLFEGLAQLPFWYAYLSWDVAGLVMFVLAARRIATWCAIGLGLLSFAVIETLVHGQTSLIISALVMGGITDKRPSVAGLLLGIAATIKPQATIAVAIALLLNREYWTLAWMGLTISVATTLSCVLWGFLPWLHWFASLDDFRALLYERDLHEKVVGLTGWLYFAGLPLGLAVLWAGFKKDRYRTVAVANVLVSPYTMGYDLAGLAVIASAILINRDERSIEWASAAAILSAYFATIGVIGLAISALIRRKPCKGFNHLLCLESIS